MKYQRRTTSRSAKYLLLALAALALWRGPVGVEPASAQAPMEDYWVWGRVYSAIELPPQDDLDAALRDLLSEDPEELVGPENLYPITTRNLVRLSLFDAESGNPLGSSFLTTYDGGYLIFFQTLASEPDARAVRFEVRDGVSDERLLASDPVTVRVGDNMRHLLVPGDTFEVEGVIPFAPGDDAFVFTRVGKVEVTEIDDDGFANVSPAAAAALLIPQYRDAPFGGNLYLFGAFSENLYDGNHCYQIHADGVALDRPCTRSATRSTWPPERCPPSASSSVRSTRCPTATA